MTLHDRLVLGPDATNLNEDGIKYAIFAFSVLSAFIVGWMVLMWFEVGLAVNRDPHSQVNLCSTGPCSVKSGLVYIS